MNWEVPAKARQPTINGEDKKGKAIRDKNVKGKTTKAIKKATAYLIIVAAFVLAGAITQQAQAEETAPIDVPEIINLLECIETNDGTATAVVGDWFEFDSNDVKAIPQLSGITKFSCCLEEKDTGIRTEDFAFTGKKLLRFWYEISKKDIGKTYRLIIKPEETSQPEYAGGYFEVLKCRDRGTVIMDFSSRDGIYLDEEEETNENFDRFAFVYGLGAFVFSKEVVWGYDGEDEDIGSPILDLDRDGLYDIGYYFFDGDSASRVYFLRTARNLTGTYTLTFGDKEYPYLDKLVDEYPDGPLNYYSTIKFIFPPAESLKKRTQISSIADKAYTGKTIKPSPAVKIYGDKLVKGVHYTVTYKNNRNVGKATVIVKGKKVYKGTLKKTFKILPKGTTLSSLKKGSKSMTVKWNKQAAKMSKSHITGYQIRYATKSSMASAKKVLIKGYTKTSKKITGLKSGKKYYVQVRTYKTVKGVKYYSKWSAKKSVKAN